ncbi:MAG: ABC transporter substrate-binding protein [Patescibacteria group bacterium]
MLWFKFLNRLVRKYFLLLLASGLIGGIAFLLINRLSPYLPQLVVPTKRIGLVGRYTSLNTLPEEISLLSSYGLTEILPNGRATASAIVARWMIKNDGKEQIFTLKPDVKWQDGSLLKSQEINYQIKGVTFEQTDDGIKIALENPLASLPVFLSQPIYKQKLFFRQSKPLGLGEYQIKKIQFDGSYFKSILLRSQDKKEKINFRFYPNQESLKNGLMLGEVDQIQGVDEIGQLANWQQLDIQPEDEKRNRYTALFFNTRKEPFSQKQFRQALAYAVDKPSKKDRALTPISPLSWAYNNTVKSYSYNPQHAKKLLEGINGLDNLLVKIYVLPELLDDAEAVKKNWQENLGINSEISVTSVIPNPEEFDVYLGFGAIPPDPDQYFFWHSTQERNISGINNPRIDQLLEDGRKTIVLEERKPIYKDFQRFLLEECPAVFLKLPTTYTITRK